MHDSLHITVVIPAFNEEKTLASLLKSLRNQTYKDFDIIVANNNSTDDTAQIAREYGASVITVQKRGYVYALQEGMMSAKSKVIAVSDADTIVDKDWLKVIAEKFSDTSVVAATGSISISNSPFSFVMNQLYSLFLIFHFAINKPHLIGFNFAVRKSAFEEAGGLNTAFTMSPDVDLGLRLKQYGNVVFIQGMSVIPSMRRWEDGAIKTFIEYAKGYYYTLWLRKPPPVKQSVIRS